ncbi:hypothetical protein ACFWYW_58925 [Nonomuraea sp. NPDC059023]|uniref:hypothetical protein n=1 Tax=unclassified Nonomuraea TaxID=2593643 RepID=UPI00367385F3
MSVYLVWSNVAQLWWKPGRCGYTADLWDAGRFSAAQAADVCKTRTWEDGKPPPEVMVLAPEGDRGTLHVEEIRAAPEVMRRRVAEATKTAIEARNAFAAFEALAKEASR